MESASLLSTSLVYVVSAVVLQHFAVAGQLFSFGRGVQWTNSGRAICLTDTDCDPDGATGEVCWRLYDGCTYGKCMCDPRTHLLEAGRCLLVRRSNEPCGVNDTCVDSLTCINGTCRCAYDQSRSVDTGFDPSDQYCVQPTDRFIGKPCRPSTHVCYHLTSYGFSANEVECNALTGLCSCREGYKQDRSTCRRFRIWEVGCRDDFHCGGGAVCVNEQCLCPSGYRAVAGNTKCAKSGAVLELPIGLNCDEFHERGYCAYGLVCHKCRDTDARPICARYMSGYEPERSAFVSRSSRPNDSIAILVVMVTAAAAVTLILARRMESR